MLEYDCDGEGIPTVILSETKDLAEPGNGTLWAQILRQGLRMTILTQKDFCHPRRYSAGIHLK